MRTLILLLVSTINFSSFSHVEKQVGCADVHSGTFHLYPLAGKEHYKIVRKDTLQTETNLKEGTTSYWKITWLSDCVFTADYLSGGKIESKEQEEFYKTTKTLFTITQTSKDYYLFTGTITLLNGKQYTYSDTSWMHER